MLWIMVVFSSKWMFLSVSTYLIQICIWNLLKNWVVVHILKNKCSFYVTVILNNVANRSISGNSTTGGKLDSVHHSDLPIRGPRNRQYRPKSPRSHSRMDSENKSDRCTYYRRTSERMQYRYFSVSTNQSMIVFIQVRKLVSKRYSITKKWDYLCWLGGKHVEKQLFVRNSALGSRCRDINLLIGLYYASL